MTDKITTEQIIAAQDRARVALMDLIADSVANIRDNTYTLASQSSKTRDLAYAYRLVEGGPQPGSVEVSSK
ncbi:hypothetical protein ACTJI8_02875 [Microbacterium sp. 22303]|uniref:hypothetical protein n=1 Tax=Microbacterium sp. 22303 TaxID=3453905 RepID=UPI003F835D98